MIAPACSRPSWLRACLCLALLAAGGGLGLAAPVRMPFQLPRGPAEDGLRAFAVQTGVELVFNVEQVEGVVTRPVRGNFTPREALERMLAGTALAVSEDGRTGAFLIHRKPRTVPPPSRARRTRPDSALSEDRPADSPFDSDPLLLSPFLVQTDRDSRYAASATLSGTRLNTPLRDLGASVSVYGKNLFSDLGVSNHHDLLVYATGMESGGPGGNFSNGANDINNPQVVGDGTRNSPQTQWRTRGLAAPNATRGFFVNDIAGDAYNTESLTVSRGPNAILAGVGSPAGVVNTTLIRPDLTRSESRLETRVGDNSSFRQVLDLNRVLIPGRLGLRLAALHDEERYDQRPAHETKRRLFGTASFEPSDTTALRVHFETGRTRANRPFQVMPFNSVSGPWLEAGRPTWDWNYYDDPERNPSAASQQANEAYASSPVRFLIGQAQIFGGLVTPFASGDAATPDFGFRSTAPTGSGVNSVRIGLVEPRVNRDAAFDTIAFYETFNLAEIPAASYPDLRRPAGIKFQGFTDFEAFDFRRRQIDETGRQSDDFHTVTASLEQRAWQDRAGVEVAWYAQRYDNRNRNSFFGTQGNANHVRIDPNVYLPDGRLNPNVGRPYAVMSQQQYGNSFTDRQTVRATAYLKYDFKEHAPNAGRLLGRHTLTVLGERARTDSLSYFTTLRTTGVAADQISATINTFNRLPNLLVYLGDSVLDGSPLRLHPIRAPNIADGLTVPTGFFSAPAGTPATTQAEFVTVPVTLKEIFTSGTVQRELITSVAAVLQSSWWDDLLVTTAGWRRDEDFLHRESLAYDPARPDLKQRGFDEFALPSKPPSIAAEDLHSLSAVLRWPHRLQALPEGMDLSFFWNTSENFTPQDARVNFFNERLASPAGRTVEVGLAASFWGERLSLRYTRFTTKVEGASYVVPFNYQNAIIQMTGFWHTERNLNPAIDRTAEVEEIFAALPPNFREIYQFQYFGRAEDGNLARTTRSLSGVTDTTDYEAQGHELEIHFVPHDRLQVMANIASQDTEQRNIAPFTRNLIERLRPVWDRLSSKPRANYPSGYEPGAPLPVTTETVGQYVASNVYVPYATMIATEGSAAAEQRKWRANLVGYYRFPVIGRLRGWGVGAGVRWQSKIRIGYPASYRPDGSVSVDLGNPFYGPAETQVDLFAGYRRRIFGDRMEWKIQLNLRNAFSSQDPIPITAQPDGSTASARLAPERRWYVTQTLSF